jgi:glucan phosphoethanolaminetransferase (alkaline phosphatase superfamily)
MRATYRVLALLIAVGVVVQAAFIAVAWFQVLHDSDSGAVFDKNSEPNWAYTGHSVVGTLAIPIIALVLLILSFFARIPGGVKWAAITFGVVLLQIVFAFLGFAAPVLGALHGINAFALAGVASVAARKARMAETAPVEPAAPVGSA